MSTFYYVIYTRRKCEVFFFQVNNNIIIHKTSYYYMLYTGSSHMISFELLQTLLLIIWIITSLIGNRYYNGLKWLLWSNIFRNQYRLLHIKTIQVSFILSDFLFEMQNSLNVFIISSEILIIKSIKYTK